MFQLIKNWYNGKFSDPRAASLAFILIIAAFILYFFIDLIAPILVSIVVAYVLDLIVVFLHTKLNLSRTISVWIVFSIFVLIIIFILLVLIPAMTNQVIRFSSELPNLVKADKIKQFVSSLQENYPTVINEENLVAVIEQLKDKTVSIGNLFLPYLFNSLLSIVTFSIYVFLVPLMALFMLKDKHLLLSNARRLLPKNFSLISELNFIMHGNIKNYIVGKVFEFLLMFILTYIELSYFNVNYALLLSFIVGMTVFVPYVGVIIAVIPVLCVAISQFGLTSSFYYLMLIFLITQIVDGNVLVPILFAEAVNLHPLIILISVLIFGGLLGFWGVFFAIPLASLIKSVIEIWPSSE